MKLEQGDTRGPTCINRSPRWPRSSRVHSLEPHATVPSPNHVNVNDCHSNLHPTHEAKENNIPPHPKSSILPPTNSISTNIRHESSRNYRIPQIRAVSDVSQLTHQRVLCASPPKKQSPDFRVKASKHRLSHIPDQKVQKKYENTWPASLDSQRNDTNTWHSRRQAFN